MSGRISEEGPGRRRPDFVLGDRDGSTCEPEFTAWVAKTLRGMGYEVAINDPYKGVELVRAFSDPATGRHSLQVEANRALYMDERTRERTPGFAELERNLSRLLEAVAGYAAERGSHACTDPHHHHGHHHDHGHHHGRHHGHDHGHSHDHGPGSRHDSPEHHHKTGHRHD